MKISYMNSLKPSILGNRLASKGEGPGYGGEVIEMKLWIKGQQAIWDIRIQTGDTTCDLFDFMLINVSGNQ